MCNIDCGAIPIKVPPADAFIPYVNRAEIAAKEAQESAQQAKEAVESIADISNQVEQVHQLAQEAQESANNANNSATEAQQYAQQAENSANNVNVFIPNVSTNGELTWTNKAGLQNPEPVNIKGPQGEKGEQGLAGKDGANGVDGKSATIQIGTVTTGEPGTQASVINSGTNTDAVFDFTIPAGKDGTSGDIDTSGLAKLTENNTFNGTNTFNNTVNVPEPAYDNNAINKSYGDKTYSKIENTMNIKTLIAPLDDWYNLQTGIYAVDTANFFASSTLHKPPVPQGGLCMVYNAGEYAQIEFYPDNYNVNPATPKCVLRKINNKWANWYTEVAPIYLFVSPVLTGTPTAPTAEITENSTRIATTEFARSLLQLAVGKTEPTLTALIDWDAMATANGGKDVRTHSSSDIYVYNGVSALNGGDIILKQAYTNYDALFVLFSTNDGSFKNAKLIPLWELNTCLDTQGNTCFVDVSSISWNIKGKRNTTNPSTDTRFNIYTRSCGIIEIYGVTY